MPSFFDIFRNPIQLQETKIILLEEEVRRLNSQLSATTQQFKELRDRMDKIDGRPGVAYGATL